jgi:hypothetical protein
MWWVPLLLNVFALGYFTYGFFGQTGAPQVHSLSTLGTYLYVSFFLSLYLAFVLRIETSRRIRLIAWGVLVLALSGVVGVFLNSEPPVASTDILEVVQGHDSAMDDQCRNTRFLEAVKCVRRMEGRLWAPLFTLTSSHSFEAVVEFGSFPNEMASYLERASRGDVRLLVELYLFRGPLRFDVTLSDSRDRLELEETTKYAFTPSQAAEFYDQKRIVFKTALGEGEVMPIPPLSFWVRNHEYRIPYRRDSARFDGQPFAFPKGDTFLAAFHFETRDHVPLAVFF